MDARTKVALSIVLGVVGISLATLVFGAGNINSFLVEFSKWAPATLVSVFALWSADKAQGEAKESRSEAQAGREQAERSAELARLPDKDKRAQRRIDEKLTHGTGVKGAARKAKAKADANRETRKAVKSALRGG